MMLHNVVQDNMYDKLAENNSMETLLIELINFYRIYNYYVFSIINILRAINYYISQY